LQYWAPAPPASTTRSDAGLEYEIITEDGQLVLEALNDGVPLQLVYLPLVAR
jgi:hypothetical protein